MTDQAQERWAPVPGRAGYEASDYGRVRFYGDVLRQNGTAYLRVTDKRRKSVALLVHVLVLEAFVGPRPAGMQARHLNGDSFDNRAANLRWGTPKENAADRRAHEAQRAVGEIPPSRLAGRTVCVADDLVGALDEFCVADSRRGRSGAANYLIWLGLQSPQAQRSLTAYRAKVAAAEGAA